MKSNMMKMLALALVAFMAVACISLQAADQDVDAADDAEAPYTVSVSFNRPAIDIDVSILLDGQPVASEVLGPDAASFSAGVEAGDYVLSVRSADGSALYYERLVPVSDDVAITIFQYTVNVKPVDLTNKVDYVLNSSVTNPTVTEPIVFAPVTSVANSESFILTVGDTYTGIAKMLDTEIAGQYAEGLTSTTFSSAGSSATLTLKKATPMTLTVPADADAFLGYKSKHYVDFASVEPSSFETADGMSVYTYNLGTGSVYNFRVGGDGYVTYGAQFTMYDGAAYTVTADMLQPEGFTSKTVDRDPASANGWNDSNIFLNINAQGYLSMGVGDVKMMMVERVFQAVDNITNNYFIEPDLHYEVIGLDGQPSTVVSIDGAKLVAESEGTAIVLVSYDSMTRVVYDKAAVKTSYQFGAIWPENTGVFVVTVGAGEPGIETGMTINEGLNPQYKLSGDAIDAECDVLYYLSGTDGAKYTFTPEAGCDVSVLNPVLGANAITGFTDGEVADNGDGSFTVTLTDGRNIVAVSKDGKTAYQVISARAVDAEVTNLTDPERDFVLPGDQVQIVFDTVFSMCNKMSGLYNFNNTMVYTDGTAVYTGASSQYTFGSTAGCQTITVTVPASVESDGTYVLIGYLKEAGFGSPVGIHRNLVYGIGAGANFTAISISSILGAMPVIELPVGEFSTVSFDTCEYVGAEYSSATAPNSWSATSIALDNIETPAGVVATIVLNTAGSQKVLSKDIPDFLALDTENASKRHVLSGIPAEPGIYAYSVTIGSSAGMATTFSGKIVVTDSTFAVPVAVPSGSTGTAIELPEKVAAIAEGKGVEFKGWNTEKDGSGTMYQPGDVIDASSDMVLYAQYAPIVVEGDVNGDGKLDSDDAVYLLYHVFFEDMYPISIDCDFNGDGKVDSDDAVYLLYHIFFTDLYPLHP